MNFLFRSGRSCNTIAYNFKSLIRLALWWNINYDCSPARKSKSIQSEIFHEIFHLPLLLTFGDTELNPPPKKTKNSVVICRRAFSLCH